MSVVSVGSQPNELLVQMVHVEKCFCLGLRHRFGGDFHLGEQRVVSGEYFGSPNSPHYFPVTLFFLLGDSSIDP